MVVLVKLTNLFLKVKGIISITVVNITIWGSSPLREIYNFNEENETVQTNKNGNRIQGPWIF